MRQDLDALVLARSEGIPIGLSSILASAQIARDWYSSPSSITHLRSELVADLDQAIWSILINRATATVVGVNMETDQHLINEFGDQAPEICL